MKTKDLDILKKHGVVEKNGKYSVGGSLYLEGTGITSLPEGLTVGDSLDLRGTGITDTSKANKVAPTVYFFHNHKYIKADGIFSEVISERGNLFKIRSIGASKITFLITDGQNHWSHGDTLKEAKDDLIFKVCDRNKSDYENLTLESELTHTEAITCYRVITGACSFGTKDFVNNRLNGHKKAKYTVAEMIKITVGEYGNTSFANFFKK